MYSSDEESIRRGWNRPSRYTVRETVPLKMRASEREAMINEADGHARNPGRHAFGLVDLSVFLSAGQDPRAGLSARGSEPPVV